MKKLIFFIFMVAFAGVSFAQQDIENCFNYKEAGGNLLVIIAFSVTIIGLAISDNKKAKQSIRGY